MKTTKRVLAFLIGFMMLMTAANAAVINGDEITAPPDDWTLTSASIENGDMHLQFDTTAGAARGKSEITTSVYSFADTAFFLSFDSLASVQNDGSKVEQSINMADDNPFNTNKLFSIKDGKISVFGEVATADCAEDTPHRVTLAVDPTGETVKGIAWVDGQKVYSGDYTAWKSTIDLSAVKLVIRNNATASIADKACWTVSGFIMNAFSDNYQFSSFPTDGQEMVSPKSIDGVTVRFGTRMADFVYEKSNYTISDANGTIDFTVKQSGNDIKLIPTNGFLDRTSYTVTVAQVVDLWGVVKESAARTIAFTTAYEGYVAPVVSVTGETTRTIYQGQSEEIEFTANKEITRMDILQDGVKMAELYSAPYCYTLSDTEIGTVSITAVAYDAVGGSGTSPAVTVQTLGHAAPTVEVSGIENGASYNVTELPTAVATASDDNGVQSIAVYVDGTQKAKIEGDTLRFSLSNIAAGSHTLTFVAMDIYGLTASGDYTVSVVSDTYVTAYQYDFENYNGNNAAPSGMEGLGQRGYLDVGAIDEAHGKSLLIGIEEANTEYNENNTAFVGIPQGGSNGKMETSFDMYFSAKPSGQYRLSMKKSGSAETNFMLINGSAIRFCSKSWTVSKEIPYETGVWYRFKLIADVPSRTYTVTITAPDGTSSSETGVMEAGQDTLNYVRFFGPADDAVPSFVAVDNVLVRRVMDFPTLSVEDTVDPEAGSVTVISSQNLKTDDINLENVSLSDAYGEVALKSVTSTRSTSMVIKPVSPLKSNTIYKITLSPKVRFDTGTALGAAVEGAFTTGSAKLDVVSGTFESGQFRYTAQNQTGSAKKLTVIVQKWTADGSVTKLQVAEQEVTTGQYEYSVSVPSCVGGEYVTVFFWDGLVASVPVSTKVWSTK